MVLRGQWRGEMRWRILREHKPPVAEKSESQLWYAQLKGIDSSIIKYLWDDLTTLIQLNHDDHFQMQKYPVTMLLTELLLKLNCLFQNEETNKLIKKSIVAWLRRCLGMGRNRMQSIPNKYNWKCSPLLLLPWVSPNCRPNIDPWCQPIGFSVLGFSG